MEATEEEKENAKQLIMLSDAANKIAGVGYYDVYTKCFFYMLLIL